MGTRAKGSGRRMVSRVGVAVPGLNGDRGVFGRLSCNYRCIDGRDVLVVLGMTEGYLRYIVGRKLIKKG